MDDVEPKFAHQRSSELTSLAMRHRHADKNLAVMKRDYVGGSGLVKKLFVQNRHAFVRNEQDMDLIWKIDSSGWSNLVTASG